MFESELESPPAVCTDRSGFVSLLSPSLAPPRRPRPRRRRRDDDDDDMIWACTAIEHTFQFQAERNENQGGFPDLPRAGHQWRRRAWLLQRPQDGPSHNRPRLDRLPPLLLARCEPSHSEKGRVGVCRQLLELLLMMTMIHDHHISFFIQFRKPGLGDYARACYRLCH